MKHYWKYIPWYVQLFVVQNLCSVGLVSWVSSLSVAITDWGDFEVAKTWMEPKSGYLVLKGTDKKFNHLIVKTKSIHRVSMRKSHKQNNTGCAK